MALREQLARLRRLLIGTELWALSRRELQLLEDQREQQDILRAGVGAMMARDIAGASSCNEAEFRVFSQFGEDGIIEFLLQHADISPSSFVEIGVESYAEANTRFLAEHRLWPGLIVDANPHLWSDLIRTKLHWRSQVRAVSTFVTRDNAVEIVEPFVGTDGLGLLSVDIDGVDYWVLEQLAGLNPALVIVEYNPLFGPLAAVSVPYDPEFDVRRPEYHGIYHGASLGAFDHLLTPLGYALVACTTAGNNAFFVRSQRLGDVRAKTTADAYRPQRYVGHRTVDGTLTGITDPRRQLHDVRHLPLIDVTDGRQARVADIVSDWPSVLN